MSSIFGQGRGVIVDALISTRQLIGTGNLAMDALHSKAMDLHHAVVTGAEDRRDEAADRAALESLDYHVDAMLQLEDRLNSDPKKAILVARLQKTREERAKMRAAMAKKEE